MKKLSEEYFSFDDMLKNDYSKSLMIKYENLKLQCIYKIFEDIFSCFHILNDIPCSIYLNGSFARKSIVKY